MCAENYAFRQTSQQCERCSEKSGLDAVTILFFVIIGICALIAGALYCNAGFREKVQSLDDFIMFLCVKMKLVNAESKTLEADVGIMRRLLKVRIKSYILVWQIISLLPFTLNLSYPNVYDTIASILNIFNLGISVSSLVTCSTGSNFDAIDDLVLTTVYPIVVMCLLWILHAVHVILRKARGANFVAQISARYFSAFLVFTYLILPYITVTIFQTFSCADVDPDDADSGDDRFMAIDYSVSCSSLKYQFGFIWALICVLIYPVGIPVYYFYLLYSAKNDISCRSNKMSADSLNHIKPIELLYESYEPDLWYWEVVETVHRLMLTGLLVIIGRGSGAQIVIGSIFALFYLKLCDVYRPYIDQEAQTLREICQWQIFLLFFWSIVLKAEFNSVHSVALEVLLVLTIVSNLVIDFVLSVRNHYREKDAASDCNSISFACSENPLTTDMSITNTERSTIEMTDIE